MNRKRLFAAILSLTLLGTSAPAMAYQTIPVYDAEAQSQRSISLHDSSVNPMYEGSELTSLLPKRDEENDNGIQLYDADSAYTDIDDAAAAMRDYMKSRAAEFTINYEFKSKDKQSNDDLVAIERDIFDRAMKHTGEPTEGDYLRWQYKQMDASIVAIVDEDDYSMFITFKMTYYTTVAEEREVTEALQSALEGMQLDGLSDQEKVRHIYDYICNTVTYDREKNDDHRYSAYGALLQGKAGCQGYALLFYRMALEENIDARLVTGNSSGEGHGWNIVRLGDEYYNVDATWDAGATSYRYFLKSDPDFNGHTRDEKYQTMDFYSQYPMAQTSSAMSAENGREQIAATAERDGGWRWTCCMCGRTWEDIQRYSPDYIVLSQTSYVYDGKRKEPELIVKDSSGSVISDKYYTVEYPKGSKRVGRYTVKVKFDGTAYKGTMKAAYTIAPKSTSLKSLSARAKGFTAVWRAGRAQTTGYQLQYSTDSSFANAKTVRVSGSRRNRLTVKRLSANRTYFVRVRAYKTVNGERIYSDWSDSKKVKI